MRKQIVLIFIVLWLVATFLCGQVEHTSGLFETNFSGVIGSGARALGMGGAFIAIADDATAATWNPGGLGQLETPEFSLGLRYQEYRKISPAVGNLFTFRGAMDMNTQFVDIDYIAFTYPIRVGDFKIVPQISYQRGISFNFKTNINAVQYYNKMWLSNVGWTTELGNITNMAKINGGVDYYSVSLGSTLFKHLNVGVSVNLWTKGYYANVEENTAGLFFVDSNPTNMEDASSLFREKLDLNFRGVNYTVGALLDLSEKVKVGLVYKNAFSIDLNYKLINEFNSVLSGVTSYAVKVQTEGSTTLRWPETVGFGISYRPIDPLTISADFTHTRWDKSIFTDFPYYEADGVTNTAGWLYADVYFPTLNPVGENGFKQLDTRQLRLGSEYVLIGSKVLIPLRVGLFTDSQYFADTSGKAITFFGLTGGMGLKWKGLSADLAVLYELGNYLRDPQDYSETRVAELRVYLSTSYSF